jgi:hypothetical protein
MSSLLLPFFLFLLFFFSHLQITRFIHPQLKIHKSHNIFTTLNHNSHLFVQHKSQLPESKIDSHLSHKNNTNMYYILTSTSLPGHGRRWPLPTGHGHRHVSLHASWPGLQGAHAWEASARSRGWLEAVSATGAAWEKPALTFGQRCRALNCETTSSHARPASHPREKREWDRESGAWRMNEEKEREIVTVVECRKIQILPLQGGRDAPGRWDFSGERERWGWVLGTLVSELLFPGINNVTFVPGCIPASTNVRMTHLYRVDTPQYKCGTFVSGGMSHPDLRTNSNARIHVHRLNEYKNTV